MMETVIKGKAWVGGDSISTYAILPKERWIHNTRDIQMFGPWSMEDADEAFKGKEWGLRDSGATIIVAGKNFGGGGKTLETPVFGLIGAGIKALIAETFARTFFRNCVNNALPVFTCKGLSQKIQTGDELVVDMDQGYIEIVKTGERLNMAPLSSFCKDLIEAGGLLEYTKQQFAVENTKG